MLQTLSRAEITRRVLAEFWADGPDSETPPGHWFVLLNGVMEHPDFTSQWLGEGELWMLLQYTVRAYLTLGRSHARRGDCRVVAQGLV